MEYDYWIVHFMNGLLNQQAKSFFRERRERLTWFDCNCIFSRICPYSLNACVVPTNMHGTYVHVTALVLRLRSVNSHASNATTRFATVNLVFFWHLLFLAVLSRLRLCFSLFYRWSYQKSTFELKTTPEYKS